MSTTPNTPSEQNDKVEEYDLVILGGGTGGTVAAWTFAGKGQRVAVIERKYVGGSCPNIACLPSKNVIHSAKVASYFRRSEELGYLREISRSTCAPSVSANAEWCRIGTTSISITTRRAARNSFLGRVVSLVPKTIEAILPDGRRRRLRGKNVIINTGTRAARASVSGLNEAEPPRSHRSIGTGSVTRTPGCPGRRIVGLELAQAMRRFGSKLAVVDRNSRLT